MRRSGFRLSCRHQVSEKAVGFRSIAFFVTRSCGASAVLRRRECKRNAVQLCQVDLRDIPRGSGSQHGHSPSPPSPQPGAGTCRSAGQAYPARRLGAGDRLPTGASVMSGVRRQPHRRARAISKLRRPRVSVEDAPWRRHLRAGQPGGRVVQAQRRSARHPAGRHCRARLRIGLETETAALVALRRTDANLATMRQALDTIAATLQTGENAVASDFQFHSEIARATQNAHFYDLMLTLGVDHSRARLSVDAAERASELASAPRAGRARKHLRRHRRWRCQATRAAMRMHTQATAANAAAARRPAEPDLPRQAPQSRAAGVCCLALVAGPSELCVSDWADPDRPTCDCAPVVVR